MSSVMEGVETLAQLTAAAEAGAHEVQGYYFNMPVPASDVVLAINDTKLRRE